MMLEFVNGFNCRCGGYEIWQFSREMNVTAKLFWFFELIHRQLQNTYIIYKNHTEYTTNENQLTKSSIILACFFPLTNLRKTLSVPFLDADSSVAAAITSIRNMNSTIFLVNFVVEVDIFTKIQSFEVCQEISVEIRAE